MASHDAAVPPSPPRRTRWVRLVGWALLIGLASFLVLVMLIDRYGQVERARPADAIVILGARVMPDGRPGDSLRARTEQAVALYRHGLAPKVICTGGVGQHGPAEADAAAVLAMELGVPSTDILRETRSTSTRGNAREAAAICRAQGWTRVIVVSDPYHLWRARRNFTREGLTVYTSPARTCVRYRNVTMRAQWTLREALLIIRDGVQGQ